MNTDKYAVRPFDYTRVIQNLNPDSPKYDECFPKYFDYCDGRTRRAVGQIGIMTALKQHLIPRSVLAYAIGFALYDSNAMLTFIPIRQMSRDVSREQDRIVYAYNHPDLPKDAIYARTIGEAVVSKRFPVTELIDVYHTMLRHRIREKSISSDSLLGYAYTRAAKRYRPGMTPSDEDIYDVLSIILHKMEIAGWRITDGVRETYMK